MDSLKYRNWSLSGVQMIECIRDQIWIWIFGPATLGQANFRSLKRIKSRTWMWFMENSRMLYSSLEISENFRTFFDFIFWVVWMMNFVFDLSRKMQLTCGQLIPSYHLIRIIRSRSHSFRIMLYHTLFELNRHSETNCKKSDILYRPPLPPTVGHRPGSKLHDNTDLDGPDFGNETWK